MAFIQWRSANVQRRKQAFILNGQEINISPDRKRLANVGRRMKMAQQPHRDKVHIIDHVQRSFEAAIAADVHHVIKGVFAPAFDAFQAVNMFH